MSRVARTSKTCTGGDPDGFFPSSSLDPDLVPSVTGPVRTLVRPWSPSLFPPSRSFRLTLSLLSFHPLLGVSYVGPRPIPLVLSSPVDAEGPLLPPTRVDPSSDVSGPRSVELSLKIGLYGVTGVPLPESILQTTRTKIS